DRDSGPIPRRDERPDEERFHPVTEQIEEGQERLGERREEDLAHELTHRDPERPRGRVRPHEEERARCVDEDRDGERERPRAYGQLSHVQSVHRPGSPPLGRCVTQTKRLLYWG